MVNAVVVQRVARVVCVCACAMCRCTFRLCRWYTWRAYFLNHRFAFLEKERQPSDSEFPPQVFPTTEAGKQMGNRSEGAAQREQKKNEKEGRIGKIVG